MKKLILLITSLLFIIGLYGCATTQKRVDTENINDLENMTQQAMTPKGPVVAKIRKQAIVDTAMSIGAQGGLALRSRQIDNMLDGNEKRLDRIFDFEGLMLPHNILPPVLEESSDSLTLTGTDVINVSDHTYRILKQARFVTAPPTWREFLWLDYKKPSLPDTTLLPRNKQERKLWKKYIRIGWQNGITQANNIYANNLASLKDDYEGMALYRKLLAKHIVSKPYVATDDMGITSNASRTEMRINDKVLRITAVPELNANSNRWKPVMIQHDDRR